MKIYEKIKKFFRRIFIDYYEINRICENNIKALEEKISNNNTTLRNEIMHENEKRKEELQSLNNSFENDKQIIQNQINNVVEELKKGFSYTNVELLNIKYDQALKNILIIGFFGAPNLGDELMLETLLDYFSDIPNKKVTVLLADNPEYSIDKYKDIRFIHYPKSLYDFNIMAEQFDYILFGGGAIIDDRHYNEEKSYQYDLGTMLIKLSIRAIAFNKKVVCIALSASENIENREYLEKLGYVIQHSHYFSVRDEFTKKYLAKKLGDEYGKKINKIHDIVFSNKELLNNMLEKRNKMDRLNIGIVAISNDDNYEKMQTIINSVNRFNKNVQINLIPFYDYKHIDINFYNKIINNNKDININVEKYPEDMNQTVDLYKKNDIIIGMRYHSILIAHALNIPCVSICYDIHEHYPYKIKYLNQIFNKNDALSYINLDENEIYNELNNILRDYDNKKDLKISKQILTEAEVQIKEIIDIVFNDKNQ